MLCLLCPGTQGLRPEAYPNELRTLSFPLTSRLRMFDGQEQTKIEKGHVLLAVVHQRAISPCFVYIYIYIYRVQANITYESKNIITPCSNTFLAQKEPHINRSLNTVGISLSYFYCCGLMLAGCKFVPLNTKFCLGISALSILNGIGDKLK